MKGTNTQLKQACLTGSFIVVLTTHLNKHDLNRASTIRMNQRLRKVLRQQDKRLMSLADGAYAVVRDRHVKANLQLDVGILIETLAFNKIDAMKLLFGNDVITLIERCSAKVTLSSLTETQRRNSYKISDELIKSVEDTVFKDK